MGETKKIATRESFGMALCELAKEHDDIIVLDADLAAATKTEIFKKAYPDRFFDCGIAEANMIGVAAGLAAAGKVPFAASFAMFSTGRAYEQVRNSVGYPHLNVKIAGSHAGITVGEDGATHQCCEDLALMRTIPGMVVINPADHYEMVEAVKAAYAYNGPVYIRLGQLSSDASYTQKLIEDLSSKIDCIRYDDIKFELSSGYDDLNFLWLYFHTRKFTKAGETSKRDFSEICPVIILDQFEELFVRNEQGARNLLSQINLLLRDTLIVPDEPGYLKKYNCRFVISIREDRLYYLEEAIDRCNLPELRNYRYRLRPLSQFDAKEVILIPGKNYIEETEIEQITDMIIKHTEEKDGQISSIMLSLLCSLLYDELEDGQKITKEMQKAASELNFEAAAELRDEIIKLKQQIHQ